MNRLLTLTTAAVTAIAIGAFATSASSMTIIKAVPGGPVSGANPYVGLPVLALLKADTYDFTFTLAPPLAGSTATQLQAQAQIGNGVPEDIAFSLYSGTPTGTHSLIATSPFAISSVVSEDLTAGNYYIQITPADIVVNKEVDSGSIVTTAVPEPAAWAMMLVGFAGVGSMVRRKTEKSAAALA